MCQERSGLGVVRGRYVNTLRTKGCCVNNATLHFICSARGRQCLLDSSLRSSLLIFAREIMRVVMFSTVAEYWAGGRGGVVVVKDGSVVIPSHPIYSIRLRNPRSRSLLKPLSRLHPWLDFLEFMIMVMCTKEGRGGISS
jgi:hypothetical protein